MTIVEEGVRLKRICVFCGSSPGAKREYVEAAETVGRTLACEKITLVYGGASVGLMGSLAQACLDAGGEVIGVIPRQLAEMGLAHTGLSRLLVVDSMHERKSRMAELSDAFLALPGGLGTLEELFEILTWAQLGLHRKPCGLLNTCGYYEKLVSFLDHAVEQRFLQPACRAMIQIDDHPRALLEEFANYQAPVAKKAAWARQMSQSIHASQDPPTSGY
jgi:hypothetical protein